MRTSIHLCAVALLAAAPTSAQQFITPMDASGIMMSKEVHAITLDGRDVAGTVPSCMLNMGQLQSITIKDAAGEKHKFKAEELSEVRVKPSKFMNVTTMLSQPNMSKFLKQDFGEVLNREWVFYVQTSPPGKDKKVMMQLLNPGFDKKMKVFQDPMAQQTGGGDDKSYFVVKAGSGEAIKVKKNMYKKEALTTVFGDCKVMVEFYSGDKMRLEDFAEHVFIHDQLCE